jgi:hypothetical protein
MENQYVKRVKPERSFHIYTETGHEYGQTVFTQPEKQADPKIKKTHVFVVDWQITKDTSPMYA